MRYGFLMLLVCLFSFPVHAELQDGGRATINAEQQDNYKQMTFERIVDGDTFVASGKKIRMWGINAPEKNQVHYLASKLYLEVLLKKGDLRCKYIEDDKYQRAVMHCTSKGHDIGSDMVRMGLAKDYDKYSGGFYNAEQKFAEEHKYGIWK